MTTVDATEITDRLRDLGAASRGLIVFDTVADDGRPHPSVVNAGVMPHPGTGVPVVALVVIGGSRKIRHLERDPRATATFRDGARWLTVHGDATLIGPDHRHPDVPADAVPELLREIYRVAGGGEHPDWADYDKVMAEQRRTAVLLGIGRTYGIYWPVGGDGAEA
jgi:PPOX class probable F420-dependent enzyme